MSSSAHEICPQCDGNGYRKLKDGASRNEEIELKETSSDPLSSQDSEPTFNTDIDLVLPTSSASTSSSASVCRICQTGGKGQGEALQSSACNCKGNMSRVHESCLRQWVRYKGSNRCEICNVNFANILPPRDPGILQVEALQQLQWHLDRARPFNRRKRAVMGATIIFLVIVTAVTALLTVSADRDYKRATTEPWYSKKDVEETNIVFSICIAFAFFCATLTVGLIIIWLGMECCFIVNRRSIMRRANRRLFPNGNPRAI